LDRLARCADVRRVFTAEVPAWLIFLAAQLHLREIDRSGLSVADPLSSTLLLFKNPLPDSRIRCRHQRVDCPASLPARLFHPLGNVNQQCSGISEERD
jgi:hypothetical protein